MLIWNWDTETAPIEPGWQAPPIVCLTEQYVLDGEKSTAVIHHWTESRELVGDHLLSPNTLIVGHNVAYDLRVVCAQWPEFIPLVFAAYDQDRVTDTMLRQKLLDIAAGKYRGYLDPHTKVWRVVKYELGDVCSRHSQLELQKDAWRLSYGWFRDTPLEQWVERAVEVQRFSVPILAAERERLAQEPKNKALKKRVKGLEEMIASDPSRCVTYPVDDARATCDIYVSQEKHKQFLEDQFRLARRQWALGLASCWGLRTDEAGVRALEAETRVEYEEIKLFLQDHGIVKPDGVRNMKLAMRVMVEACQAAGMKIKHTDAWDPRPKDTPVREGEKPAKGHTEFDMVSLSADSCLAVDDERLHEYARFGKLGKMLSNDIKAVLQGMYHPIHTRFDTAETGRTTSSGPNCQNWNTADLNEEEEDE